MPRTATSKTNGIDHLPAMLKHFDDGRLLDMTRRSAQAAERRSATKAIIAQSVLRYAGGSASVGESGFRELFGTVILCVVNCQSLDCKGKTAVR